jgi:hypothetical protein
MRLQNIRLGVWLITAIGRDQERNGARSFPDPCAPRPGVLRVPLARGRRWPIPCDVLFGIVEPISRAPIITARRNGTE